MKIFSNSSTFIIIIAMFLFWLFGRIDFIVAVTPVVIVLITTLIKIYLIIKTQQNEERN